MSDEWKKELAERLRHVAFEHDLPAWKHVVGMTRALADSLDPQIARKKAMNTKHLPLSEAEWAEGMDRTIARRLETLFQRSSTLLPVEEDIGRAGLGKLIRELVEEEGLMPSGAFAKLAEKLDPQPAAPEGFVFLLDDEGKQVKRPPVKGDWYFFESSIGSTAALATEDLGTISFPILRKLDLPNAS